MVNIFIVQARVHCKAGYEILSQKKKQKKNGANYARLKLFHSSLRSSCFLQIPQLRHKAHKQTNSYKFTVGRGGKGTPTSSQTVSRGRSSPATQPSQPAGNAKPWHPCREPRVREGRRGFPPGQALALAGRRVLAGGEVKYLAQCARQKLCIHISNAGLSCKS